MTYRPSLADIEEKSYIPSLSDLGEEENNVVQNLEKEAEINSAKNDTFLNRTPQMQEKYSNPTVMPGFSELSQEEKLKRIKASSMDPANYDPSTGRFVPPGTFENPITRLAGSILPTLLQPELSAGSGLLSRYAINPLVNALSRIGGGTAANVAYQLPEAKNMQDIKRIAKESAKLNALLESGAGVARIPGYLGEMMNPLKYASTKSNQLRNEYQSLRALQKSEYDKALIPHGRTTLSRDPKSYLGLSETELKRLGPEAKNKYKEFISDPNLQNLHELQSQIGKDAARMATNPNRVYTYQGLSRTRNALNEKIDHFLSRDINALNSYKLGREITKNKIMPYLSNKTLEKVVEGVKKDISPAQLKNAIKQGTEKITHKKSGNAYTAIPEDHALRNHLNEINHAIKFGEGAKIGLPTLGGILGSEALLPGFGTIGGIGGAGIGASLLSNTGNKALETAQLIQNALAKKLSPLYYGAGRIGIGYNKE